MTGRIYDRLVSQYGKDSIFIDVDNIQPGVDFRKRINQVLLECDILIAVIGPKWLGSAKSGSVNIQNENDWVRLEIETALNRDILIIPTLVEGAQMPRASDLPESLRNFAYRHATAVSDDQDFHVHVDRLIQSIDEEIKVKAARPGHSRPDRWKFPVLAGSAACVLLLSVGAVWYAMLGAYRAVEPPVIVPDKRPGPSAVAPNQSPVINPRPSDLKPDAGNMRVAVLEPDTTASVDAKKSDFVKPGPPKAELPKPEPVKPDFANLEVAKVPLSPPAVTAMATGKPPDPIVLEQSCGARIAKAKTDSAAMGGPFVPLSIKPSFTDAKEIRAVAISPSGTEIATAGNDGWIRFWEVSSFKLLRTLKGHDGPVYSIDYWTDGKLLASAGWDGKVKVWELPGRNPNPIHTFEVTNETRNPPVKLYSVAFFPGQPLRYLASAGEDGYVRIWDLQDKELARARPDPKDPDIVKSTVRSLSYAPNATGEFVAGGFDGKIRFYKADNIIDTKDAYARKTLRVAYSPDSSSIVSAGSDLNADGGSLKIWDAKTETSRTLSGHKDYVVSASWSPNGTQLVSGGGRRDKSVYLWDVASGRMLASFSGHQADVEAVAFYPGGSRLISVSEDKTIKVWDIASGKEILTAVGFGEKDYLVYVPEGCYSGSNGIESRINVSMGDRTTAPTTEIRRMMFTPEGFRSLLTAK